MLVTAEGVEFADQARLLRDLGCGFLQGYHYSRPLPETEVPPYLLRTKLWSGLADAAQARRNTPAPHVVTAR